MKTFYRRCFFTSKTCMDIIVGAFIYKTRVVFYRTAQSAMVPVSEEKLAPIR